MTRGRSNGAFVPRSDYYDDFGERHPWVDSGIGVLHIDIEELTDEEYAAWRKERASALARKRPIGFTADWSAFEDAA